MRCHLIRRKIKKMIRGCVGFSYVKGNLYGTMILVKGKRTKEVMLPIGIYSVMAHLSRRKNILGKILFKKRTYDFDTIVNKKKP